MKVEDGIMTMRPLDGGLEIPPHATVTLAPGGFHLMFIDLKAPLVEGAEVPVTLTFEKAGSVDTFLHVKAIGAARPRRRQCTAQDAHAMNTLRIVRYAVWAAVVVLLVGVGAVLYLRDSGDGAAGRRRDRGRPVQPRRPDTERPSPKRR